MKAIKRIAVQGQRRKFRVRNRIVRDAHGRPRLSVFRSNKHMYAQIIDDAAGRTLVAACSLDDEAGSADSANGKVGVAERVGQLIGERALKSGITRVVFDRGNFKYHGRVAALADGARSAGLDF